MAHALQRRILAVLVHTTLASNLSLVDEFIEYGTQVDSSPLEHLTHVFVYCVVLFRAVHEL